MKTIFTILFVLTIGVAAQAQDSATEVKVETVKLSIVTAGSQKEVELEKKNEVARLYKFKNSRVKKALAFTTKRNKSKLA